MQHLCKILPLNCIKGHYLTLFKLISRSLHVCRLFCSQTITATVNFGYDSKILASLFSKLGQKNILLQSFGDKKRKGNKAKGNARFWAKVETALKKHRH